MGWRMSRGNLGLVLCWMKMCSLKISIDEWRELVCDLLFTDIPVRRKSCSTIEYPTKSQITQRLIIIFMAYCC
jgi:hypothetical protein